MSKKIVYICNYATFFVSHRLPIALKAIEEGMDVHVFFGISNYLEEEKSISILLSHNIKIKKFLFSRSGTNIIRESLGLLQLIFSLAKLRPDLVHCISPKGILYGGFASKILRIKSLVLAISGMGYLFTGKIYGYKKLIQFFYIRILNFIFKHNNKLVIVQNKDDHAHLINYYNLSEEDVTIILGSGIDLNYYKNYYKVEDKKIITLVARMLYDKGIKEFVEAAKIVKNKINNIEFHLVGPIDNENPARIKKEEIILWEDKKIIVWKNYQKNIREIYSHTTIACLPSYREGMPKALLEAAACGVPVITTDTIGCRDAVIPGYTGDLVPVQNSIELANTILNLVTNKSKLEKYSNNARKFAENKFDIQEVITKTLSIYKNLINKK